MRRSGDKLPKRDQEPAEAQASTSANTNRDSWRTATVAYGLSTEEDAAEDATQDWSGCWRPRTYLAECALGWIMARGQPRARAIYLALLLLELADPLVVLLD